ncbi:cytochrome d ubiquinol oxidase subunit II [Sulfurospirillum deleyianum]|uniref:Cytochrome d ubiquinol oxidase, subunit II n=1 Tax=Sulfurospirillum deleyianum (strain ATCC 51133 / DSM 6946 / 5175) TaxID=525898 RepID=D1B3T0_SULD5|nr:cytochrome d ubiquinol oxidase subunit II [Sulfurospirillum deleyianum]ACZ12750.1 cytochrome d ubiquinol oxidase, subunit II [Sulfurospirillum deleyianum DSM 6946]
MFELLSFLQLQQLWWMIVSLLAGLFVFLMFIQGGQSLLFSLPENEVEKSMLINSLGRKWELGFTTLVLFGGALFAAFPLFYATSFGGAYWVWLAILFCFIIQAVSYEYRKKENNFLGQKTYEMFLYINGSLGVILLGVALSTLFSGASFHLDENFFVQWDSNLRGLEALFVPQNYLLAFALFFLARLSAGLYFLSNINHASLHVRIQKMLLKNTLLFLPFFLGFLAWIFLKEGFTYDASGVVSIEAYKYLKNLLALPVVAVMILLGVVLVLVALYLGIFKASVHGIKVMGSGIVLVVMGIFLLLGFNQTAFYPSISALQSSLTIENSSGSHYTLTTMSYVALIIPFVLAYISYAWYAMDKKDIDEAEIKDASEHHY